MRFGNDRVADHRTFRANAHTPRLFPPGLGLGAERAVENGLNWVADGVRLRPLETGIRHRLPTLCHRPRRGVEWPMKWDPAGTDGGAPVDQAPNGYGVTRCRPEDQWWHLFPFPPIASVKNVMNFHGIAAPYSKDRVAKGPLARIQRNREFCSPVRCRVGLANGNAWATGRLSYSLRGHTKAAQARRFVTSRRMPWQPSALRPADVPSTVFSSARCRRLRWLFPFLSGPSSEAARCEG